MQVSTVVSVIFAHSIRVDERRETPAPEPVFVTRTASTAHYSTPTTLTLTTITATATLIIHPHIPISLILQPTLRPSPHIRHPNVPNRSLGTITLGP